METAAAFVSLGISLGLGLLVGLQRERDASEIAGIRTFPLITLFGTVCAMLSEGVGGWIVAAGVISVAGATAVGNFLRAPADISPGITTEIAALVMYAVGALVWLGDRATAVGLGVGCAVLLHLKRPMHAFAGRMEDKDLRAIMRFAAITFIVLPVLPDRTYGPFDVLNPHQIWWMVVLVVGISLAGYVTLKLVGGHAGVVLGGLLGGTISSTATTVSFSRLARQRSEAVPSALLAIVLASCMVYVRVLVEIGVVAPAAWPRMAGPVIAMLGAGVLAAIAAWGFARRAQTELPESSNPTELKTALVFALAYAAVLLAVAAARWYFGSAGIYAVAAVSGLTDMDAITLSNARLAAGGSLATESAWRAVVIAAMSNLAFKTCIAGWIGGRRLLLPTLLVFGVQIAAGVVLLVSWPEGISIELPSWLSGMPKASG